MTYYDNEFYNHPDKFEILINKLKEEIAKSVKDEFINKLNKLEQENKKLQWVGSRLKEVKQEYYDKISELELKIINADKEAKKKRLSELLKDREILLYRPYYEFFKQPKCNKCNEERKIFYTTPLGKKTFEYCDCAVKIKKWLPKEYKCVEFSINKNSNIMKMKYDLNELSSVNDWYTLSYVDTMYESSMDYKEINEYKTGFKNKEDCQEYCDWLNENEE